MEFLRFVWALIISDGFIAGMCVTITLMAIVQVIKGIIEIVEDKRERTRKRKERAEKLEQLKFQKTHRTFYNYVVAPRKQDVSAEEAGVMLERRAS